LFPQFLRGQLEELPEAQGGELQAQQAVGRLVLAAADPEPAEVPVQRPSPPRRRCICKEPWVFLRASVIMIT
jgi:hypothetical protein